MVTDEFLDMDPNPTAFVLGAARRVHVRMVFVSFSKGEPLIPPIPPSEPDEVYSDKSGILVVPKSEL